MERHPNLGWGSCCSCWRGPGCRCARDCRRPIRTRSRREAARRSKNCLTVIQSATKRDRSRLASRRQPDRVATNCRSRQQQRKGRRQRRPSPNAHAHRTDTTTVPGLGLSHPTFIEDFVEQVPQPCRAGWPGRSACTAHPAAHGGSPRLQPRSAVSLRSRQKCPIIVPSNPSERPSRDGTHRHDQAPEQG